MKNQNLVILAIGSNQGNRLGYIEQAIESINNQVGSVVKVSKLYETEAWGFESDSFYNCAIAIHTPYLAVDVLNNVLSIENSIGRIRSENQGYQSRIIDIDVIAFNEEIVNTSHLNVPHPLMHERMFVLLPMRDLNLNWRHPILQKFLPELLQATQDKSLCNMIQEMKTPFQKMDLKRMNYIVIEGNIGVGKSTLCAKIAEDFNAKIVLERFADNPFLPKFYEDPSRYAFSLEMSFLTDRFQQIADDLGQFDLFKNFIISDYHIFKSLIFAKITLSEDEFRLYRKLFDIVYKEVLKPDLYVYLYQNTDQLLDNIKSRGRTYEQEINPEYLENINKGYMEYLKSQDDIYSLIIDVTNKDFVKNQEDYIFILNEIQNRTNF